MHRDDAGLVRLVLQGDKGAFGKLIDRYWRVISVLAIQKVSHSEDAEDIVQETFYKAYRSLDTLRDRNKFGSWIYNIAFKLCIDRHREKRRKRALSLDRLTDGNFQVLDENGVDPGHDEEVRDTLREAMRNLPDKYRLVITLRYLKSMSYKEIASHLDEPQGTISNRLYRASEMLRGFLKDPA
ncbi:MAG: sigma-70 family RNA polymerase sigma factor [Planctomycetota bacterium]|nr:sigma-70 family RNA polymerase sigma factor [Planctomycetota bacterium]